MDTNRDSFDKLVSGLSSVERKTLLERMQSVESDLESESLEPLEPVSEGSITLSNLLKKQSALFKLWLWVKSILSGSSVETLFNEHRIYQIGRMVDKKYPGQIDYKHGYLLSSLFDLFTELKASANFFRPYMDCMDENFGDFYVLLGSIMLPAVESQIDSEVDPYANPIEPEPRPELRTTNLRRLESIMQELSTDEKAQMYMGARAAHWLLQFVRLPFSHLLTHFNMIINNEHRCPFSLVENDLCAFARVLCNGVSIPDEALEALYLYSGQLLATPVPGGRTTEENSAELFMEKAHSMLSKIHIFIQSVPLRSIVRIATNDAQWQVDNFTGGEDWFVQFKSSWKKLFERKWSSWVQDCKKEAIRESLTQNFKLKDFPLLPERPWSELWGGIHFRYELTAGFLYWFFRQQFPTFELALKTVMLEGDFLQKQNRLEFTESFNNLIEVSISLDSLHRRLQSGGEIGLVFTRLLHDRSRTLQGQAKVEDMMKTLENDVGEILYRFGEACRLMDLLLNGILLTDKKDSRFDSISNLSDIQLTGHASFAALLAKAHLSIRNAYSLIKELESIDSPSLMR
ncbi:MAG: DUF5312 domain-containing protein [Treponema sp.]|nr:DUF5312 domain-containing protein [Treponema sp.]